MGTTKNILMQEFNGVDYDTLYPSIQPNFPNDLANMYLWEKKETVFSEDEKIISADMRVRIGLYSSSGRDDNYLTFSPDYSYNETKDKYILLHPTTISFNSYVDLTYLKNLLLPYAGQYVIAERQDTSGLYILRYQHQSSRPSSGITEGVRIYQMPSNLSAITIQGSSNTGYYFTGVESVAKENPKETTTIYNDYSLTTTNTPPITDSWIMKSKLGDKRYYSSYVGTGTNSAVLELQFPFQPRVVMFSTGQQSIDQYFTYPCMIWVQGTNQIYWDQYSNINFILNENMLQMTIEGSAVQQRWNKKDEVYYYWAR